MNVRIFLNKTGQEHSKQEFCLYSDLVTSEVELSEEFSSHWLFKCTNEEGMRVLQIITEKRILGISINFTALGAVVSVAAVYFTVIVRP